MARLWRDGVRLVAVGSDDPNTLLRLSLTTLPSLVCPSVFKRMTPDSLASGCVNTGHAHRRPFGDAYTRFRHIAYFDASFASSVGIQLNWNSASTVLASSSARW